jgi:hypothetical protein
MIKSGIILVSKYVSPLREEMICTSDAQLLIGAKSVLASRAIVLVNMTWSVQLQLDEDGENS